MDRQLGLADEREMQCHLRDPRACRDGLRTGAPARVQLECPVLPEPPGNWCPSRFSEHVSL
jgi:hypothetical protein